MTFPINSVSEIVTKLDSYIADDRPMNLDELKNVRDMLARAVPAMKNVMATFNRNVIPNSVLNSYDLLKGIL